MLQVERLALLHPPGSAWLEAALLQEQVEQAPHVLQVVMLPIVHLMQDTVGVRAGTAVLKAWLKRPWGCRRDAGTGPAAGLQ